MAKWNRRQFLSGLLAAAGADATLETVSADAEALSPLAGATTAPAATNPLASPAPPRATAPAATDAFSVPAIPVEEGARHALQEALPEGLRFGRWRIVSVLPVKLGAVPVILETRRGVRFQVDVLRRDRGQGAKRGIAETRRYALYLANLGRGMKPTREEHGLGLIWLAALLRSCERRHAPPALLTLRERLTRHPGGRFSALG
jgi:hypothetical protein